MESTVHLARAAAGPLLPCPFCGGAASVEADPWRGESVRITCGSAACPVAPKTEYLLVRFADELSAAWNARPGAAAASRRVQPIGMEVMPCVPRASEPPR